jgi:hypothetical protein
MDGGHAFLTPNAEEIADKRKLKGIGLRCFEQTEKIGASLWPTSCHFRVGLDLAQALSLTYTPFSGRLWSTPGIFLLFDLIKARLLLNHALDNSTMVDHWATF